MARDWQPASPRSSEELPHGRRHERRPRISDARRRRLDTRDRHSRGRAADPRLADPRGGRREPQSLGRQRRIAVDRRRIRRVADVAGPRGRRLLARPRGVGVMARSTRRSIWPQNAPPAGRRALDSVLPVGGVCTWHRGADRGAHRRWHLRRHGLSDDPRADHGPVGARAGTDALDRPVVGPRRRHRGARAPRVGVPARAVRVGVGVPGHASARVRRTVHGLAVRARSRERDRRPGRQPRRHPVRGPGRDTDPGHQFRARSQA